jgi:hypothetical protein
VQEALDSAAQASAAHTAAATDVQALRQQLATLQQEHDAAAKQWREQEAQAIALQEQVQLHDFCLWWHIAAAVWVDSLGINQTFNFASKYLIAINSIFAPQQKTSCLCPQLALD